MRFFAPLRRALPNQAFPMAAALAASLAAAEPAAAADLRVFSGGAPQQVVRQLAAAFETDTGHKVNLTFAVVGEIRRRVTTSGETPDAVLLPVQLLDAMAQENGFSAASRVDLARVGIGVAVRPGAASPDLSSAESVRKLLLDARSIVWSDPKSTPTGVHMSRLLDRLGIADAVRPKVVAKNAIDGGTDLVATGEAELGMFLASEILPAKGVTLAGLLPAAMQGYVAYAAVVPTVSPSPGPALAFVKFLTDPSTRGAWRAAGFEPM